MRSNKCISTVKTRHEFHVRVLFVFVFADCDIRHCLPAVVGLYGMNVWLTWERHAVVVPPLGCMRVNHMPPSFSLCTKKMCKEDQHNAVSRVGAM